MKFILKDDAYRQHIEVLKQLTAEQKLIAKKAGTDNPKFEAAWRKLADLLSHDKFDLFKIEDRFDIRALSIALTAGQKSRNAISINSDLLDSVTAILPTGSNLFIESLFQFFLSDFDSISDPDLIGDWLCTERKRKGMSQGMEENVLCADGPKFLAKQAIKRKVEFDQQVKHWGLAHYSSGDFIKRAKSIYFVEQLQSIPANEPHEILEEISKDNVANSRYDSNELIGHAALRILIDRAPVQNVHESWQNAVISIAGDPRIPKSHTRFIKWWSQLSQLQSKKVQGWLSKLDLKLFLEALEDYSKSHWNDDMMRMFPARKHFLEGMQETGTILHTKLYLSKKADKYIRNHYRKEHVPDYSIIEDGDISVIYAELPSGHMIEGSHNCKIWFYKSLHDSAPMLHYGKQRIKYRDLTTGLNVKMSRLGFPAYDFFAHHSNETFGWQNKAVNTLQNIGVKIRASDVLSDDNYSRYKRMYGVG